MHTEETFTIIQPRPKYFFQIDHITLYSVANLSVLAI